ncbi:MAG: hypothetical protein GF308_04335 [Candidatus Heimdallarchaeota archaeon]|nr:hypothetical protein [Candidatus Heimdallarchaeota archaeon]
MVHSKTQKNETKISSDLKSEECSTERDLSQPNCPHCGSKNVYGISRVVGYYSVIDNWNKSKQAELKRRQKGNYWPDRPEHSK